MRAVLFDLDDTLLDYSGGVDESWKLAVLASCADGRPDPARLLAALEHSRRWFWNDPARHRQERLNMLRAWQRIVAHALQTIETVHDGLDAAVAGRFAAHRRAVMRLFPDARETLERLRARGIPLGLVTNGDAGHQREKIERHDLARFFQVIVIEGEFGAGKPDEVVFRHALDTLGVAAADACMIGDNLDFDVEGARRVGMRSVWID